MLNEYLVKAGFTDDKLVIGNLKGIGNEFDLNNIVVRENYKISIRFNTFENALNALKALSSITDKQKKIKFTVLF